jgi:hypothetical protein
MRDLLISRLKPKRYLGTDSFLLKCRDGFPYGIIVKYDMLPVLPDFILLDFRGSVFPWPS